MEPQSFGEFDGTEAHADMLIHGRHLDAHVLAFSAYCWRDHARFPLYPAALAAMLGGIDYITRMSAGDELAHDQFLQHIEYGLAGVALAGLAVAAAFRMR